MKKLEINKNIPKAASLNLCLYDQGLILLDLINSGILYILIGLKVLNKMYPIHTRITRMNRTSKASLKPLSVESLILLIASSSSKNASWLSQILEILVYAVDPWTPATPKM